MILVLINALIIVVIGAILFWVIDRFVWNIQLANLLKNSHGADLSCWNPATIATGARRIVVLAGGRKKSPDRARASVADNCPQARGRNVSHQPWRLYLIRGWPLLCRGDFPQSGFYGVQVPLFFEGEPAPVATNSSIFGCGWLSATGNTS
jgi:hypothetical protein